LRLTFALAAAHLVTSVLVGIVAFGADFDQLRSRSMLSAGASHVHDFLMAPHGAVIRALPNHWLTQGTVPIVPLWLALHSLLWGAALAGVWTAFRVRRG
jgi:hypothetical protein